MANGDGLDHSYKFKFHQVDSCLFNRNIIITSLGCSLAALEVVLLLFTAVVSKDFSEDYDQLLASVLKLFRKIQTLFRRV